MRIQEQMNDTRLSLKKLIIFLLIVRMACDIQLSSQESYGGTELLVLYPDAQIPYKESQTNGLWSNYNPRNKRSRKMTSFMPMRGRKDGRELFKFRIPFGTMLAGRERLPSRDDYKEPSYSL